MSGNLTSVRECRWNSPKVGNVWEKLPSGKPFTDNFTFGAMLVFRRLLWACVVCVTDFPVYYCQHFCRIFTDIEGY